MGWEINAILLHLADVAMALNNYHGIPHLPLRLPQKKTKELTQLGLFTSFSGQATQNIGDIFFGEVTKKVKLAKLFSFVDHPLDFQFVNGFILHVFHV